MGASQSKSDTDDKVFYSETPIQFSEDVVNHLADSLASPQPSPERQSSIDMHVRSRIQTELERLRQEEEVVKVEIEQALEKENLDKERAMAGEEATSHEKGISGSIKSSAVLTGDLEDIRQKVERYQKRRDLEETTSVQAKGEAVVSCYKLYPTKPLDCWREVENFKHSVANAEQHYVDSLR